MRSADPDPGRRLLEDLAAFNDEAARTLHQLSIPVISAVGHEIDFTIADFVADRRAPTPSVAAELATPEREEIAQRVEALQRRATRCIAQQVGQGRQALQTLQRQLLRSHPATLLQQRQQYLDELGQRLQRNLGELLGRRRGQLDLLASRLKAVTPIHRLLQRQDHLDRLRRQLRGQGETILRQRRQRLALTASRMDALSPLATLDRGYSITLKLPEGKVLRDNSGLTPGDALETRLANGTIRSTVTQLISRKQ